MAAKYHTDDAVAAIFRALPKSALRALRDGVGDADSIRAWADSHHILYDRVIWFATGLRRWWTINPNAAEAVRTRWVVLVELNIVSKMTAADAERERRWLAAARWPEHGESLREWQVRATRMWRELQRIRNTKPNTGGGSKKPETMQRDAAFWVLVHVCGWTKDQILAKYPNLDEGVVRKGIEAIDRALA